MSGQVYSVPGQTGGRGKAFLEGGKASLTWGEWVLLIIIKLFIILFLLEEIRNILQIFKINQ